MNEREERDFQAGLAAEVDAWLRGEPTRREFIKPPCLVDARQTVV
jgi:multiple sugar transport system substrate-binding protein